MAYEGPQICIPGLVAGADLSAAGSQYKFVKISAAKTVVLCNGATDVPCGVLQNRPASGAAATVCAIGVTKVQGDADLAAGNLIGTSADGQADAKTAGTDTTEYVVGIVIEDNTAAGGYATAIINCASPHRAA
jgi:hypothetical protein